MRCPIRGNESIDDIPQPERTDPKEVFSFFGLAAYAAQVLEAELTNLIVATHLVELIPATNDDVEALFSRHYTLTLGRLIRVARSRVTLPAETEELLSEALAQRNHLIHSFFGHHSEDFMSAAGRLEMLQRLREMTILFRRADQASETVSRALYAGLGLDAETVQRELGQMTERAIRRDVNGQGHRQQITLGT